MSNTVPVLIAPHIAPEPRIEVDMPQGVTISEIIATHLPALAPEDRARLRVTLVNDRGCHAIPEARWRHVKPRAGVRVVTRLIAGKNAARTVLSVVVTVAAVALAAYFGPALAAATGLSASASGALILSGTTMLGNLLINALIPPATPEEQRDRYQISGIRNRVDPDGAVPMAFGTTRYAPPFAATSYTEIVGDWQYVRALFNFGYGPVSISDVRIGDTSIAEYDEVEIEIREGLPGDAPVSLYPRQVVEETVGAQLVRPLPRDDGGEVIDGPSVATPVIRTTGADAQGVSIILSWPNGLYWVSDRGNTRREVVDIRIEQRRDDQENWQLVEDLHVTARTRDAFYRQHSWNFPSRARWQIRLTMLTPETTRDEVVRNTVWAALQTLRPEYPIAFGQPLALIAMRIKATNQISGALDNVSAMVSRICPDYDTATGTWITRATANPASACRHALQCAANPRPEPDAGVDLAMLADWHDFCRIKNLRYDRVIDETQTSLRDVISQIAAAGRAAPRHDGMRWGVVVDRPQSLVVDHISPRNSRDFRTSRQYFQPPHALRVKFQDHANDYRDAERLVRWPGYSGEITLTEALDAPGLTRADDVWRMARRRMYEALHRPDIYQVMQDGAARVATRGDLVMLSNDVIDSVQIAARVLEVAGRMIRIDEPVDIVSGQSYGIRYRTFDAADTIGISHVRIVEAEPGRSDILTVTGSGPMPPVGGLVLFGLASQESRPVIVTGVEAGEDMSCMLRMVDAAPQIDTLLDAETVPAWSSRVGAELGPSALQPPAPRFRRVRHGLAQTGADNRIDYELVPGQGPVPTHRYHLRHRLEGGAWTTISMPVANGGGTLTYASGATVEMQPRGISSSDVEGPWGPALTIVVGSGDAPIPVALPGDSISVLAQPGGARVEFSTAADPHVEYVQLYQSRSSTLNRTTDASDRISVTGSRTYQLQVGDTARPNLLTAPGFGVPAEWDAGAGWTVAGGTATHVAGSPGDVSQSRSLIVGRFYRIAFSASGITGGTLTPALRGGSDRLGDAVAANGRWSDRLQAVTGNDRLAFAASSDFAGSIDDALLYLETDACLDQGEHHFWLEPQNADGVPGPVSARFTIRID